jgi:hypothetical protein
VGGFNAHLYQKHWALIKEEITVVVLGFLNRGHLLEIINRTIIFLIPKVKDPRDITQYRPFSICKVIYKICSKVLANSLRVMLDDIIAEEHSVFVPGCLITDNVITSYVFIPCGGRGGKLHFVRQNLI